MSLGLQTLHTNLCHEFSTRPDDRGFQSDFVHATNMALDELSFCGDLTTAIDHVQAVNENVGELAESDYYILRQGIVVNLIQAGRVHRGGEQSYIYAKSNWENRKGDFMVKESRDLQSTTDDDGIPTSDIIGLGYDPMD